MMRATLVLFFASFFFDALAQADTSTTILEVVTVKAFEQGRQQRDVPAAINVLDSSLLRRFSPSAIVQAINSTAGVRMEERSPGSYRINIRGSSLRSPFGVRNVKVYYNDLPITDPGGQTYLNALGFYNYRTVEIIKGPGSSLYGAATGGVMAIESMSLKAQPGVEAELTGGSFGSRQLYAAIGFGKKAWKNNLSWQEQRSNGYRSHAALQRTVLSWDGRYRSKQGNLLKTTVLYAQLFYETPGALTLTEYTANRKAARHAAGGFPGAEGANAAFDQRTFLGGLSYSHRLSNLLTAKVVAYGSSNRFDNPAIRNYGVNSEPHYGARASLQYRQFTPAGRLQINVGGEFQQGRASIGVYRNNAGIRDTLQTLDEAKNTQSLLYLQADYEWKGWIATGGASINKLLVRYRRVNPVPSPQQKRGFKNEVAPRLSLAKRLKVFTLYSSISKGFSPPTTSELFPSGSAVNLGLEAERGWNYEVGLRGKMGGLELDVNAFSFSLENMVVQRRDAGGGDYYTNAGNTQQRGVETMVAFAPWQGSSPFRQSRLWASHTWHRFRYQAFKQLAADYSGNPLPGVSPHFVAAGIDLLNTNGFFGNVNYLYQSAVPLNDAASAFAEDYHLVNAKIGMHKAVSSQLNLRVSVGAENLLGAEYSLGNDINAFGGRYYNAAPGRSFYVSLAVGMRGTKTVVKEE